jgi:molybdate transport system permease protein
MTPSPHFREKESPTPAAKPIRRRGVRSRSLFWGAMSTFGLLYLLLVVAMVVADLQFASVQDIRNAIADPRVRFSIALSLFSCTISAILSIWVAVPTGYLLARTDQQAIERRLEGRPRLCRLAIFGRHCVETLFDIPVVLPPLVVGISLLILFQTSLGRWLDVQVGSLMQWLGFPGIRGITYEIPAVVLAQFTVATAYAVRIMRATFEQMDAEPELAALVLGASEAQAFSFVALPQARQGIINAFTLAWARSLGEFGPILIFAGTARMKTEVLSTTVYLNFSIGNLRGAVTASLLMLMFAAVVLIGTRILTLRTDGVNVPL